MACPEKTADATIETDSDSKNRTWGLQLKIGILNSLLFALRISDSMAA